MHHEAWFVRYREPVRQPDGSIKNRQRAKKLGDVKDYPRESQIKPLFAEFMRQLNAGNVSPEACITLSEFVEKFYLKYIEEKRASTKKGYKEIWNNHLRDRIGHIRMREFRTVDASRMLKAIANENDLTRTTLQHIKGVLAEFSLMRRMKVHSMVRIPCGTSIFPETPANQVKRTRIT